MIKRKDVIFSLTLLSLSLVSLYYFRESLLPNKYVDAALSIFITFCNLLAFSLSNGRNSLMPRNIRRLAAITIFYVVVLGLFNLGSDILIFGTWTRGFFQDYRHLSFILLAFSFLDLGEQYFMRLIRFLIVIGYVSIFGCLISAEISFVDIVSRSNTWTNSYYFWWIINGFGPFLGVLYFSGQKQFKSKHLLILFIANVLLGLIFLKRAVVINFLLVLILSSFIHSIKARNLLYLVIVFVAFSYSNSVLVDSLYERFQETSNDIVGWDRLSEVSAIWDVTGISDWFIGFGANNYLRISHIINEFEVNAIHIGLFDIFYKGGIVYFAFLLYVLLKVFRSRRQGVFRNVGMISALLFTFRLTYENSSSYTSNIFFGMLFVIIIWMKRHEYSYR